MAERFTVATVRQPSTRSALQRPLGDLTEPNEPRRARKKRQTRDALIDAALHLFEAKGYEHTAVHEITDAVDVAERTFFRYFASKEDLALFFVRQEMDRFVEALAARPADEKPLTAMRNAFSLSLRQLQADGDTHNGEPKYLSAIKLIDSTPALLAANLRYVYDNSEKAVHILAKRENVDPATDRRPWLLIAIYGAIAALVHRDWRTHGRGGIEAMLAMFDAYADQLEPAVAGHWNARPDIEGGRRRPRARPRSADLNRHVPKQHR
ncbi:MAG: TetR family transcriptional regulator [Acidimicrobiales bacterium]|jgi:AcrR family transcriptional regulator